MRRASLVAITAAACGPGRPDGTTAESSAGGGGSSVDSDETGDGLFLTHGVINLQFELGDDVQGTPYSGTTDVHAAITYGKCLMNYYGLHPEKTLEGQDDDNTFGPYSLGGEAWQDRLCTPPIEEQQPCTVAAFWGEYPRFGVTYAIPSDVDLTGHLLRLGPFPTAETADCNREEAVVSVQSVYGEGEGQTLWTAAAVVPLTAMVDQESNVIVYAGAAD